MLKILPGLFVLDFWTLRPSGVDYIPVQGKDLGPKTLMTGRRATTMSEGQLCGLLQKRTEIKTTASQLV